MKKTFAILSALIGGACAIAADEPASSYSVTVDFPLVSKYVFRGVQVNKESLQPSVEATIGNAYVGLWTNIPLKDSEKAARELDLYAGYNLALNETTKLDFGATYYHYPEAPTGADDHSFEGYVGANFSFGAFTPSFYVYRDFDLETWTIQGSVGYSVPMTDLGTSLDLTFTLGQTWPDEGESLSYYSVGANVPFKVSEKLKVNVGVSFSQNDSNVLKDPGLWYTVGGTYAF